MTETTLIETLNEIGLNDKEIKIYLALVKLGESGATKLSSLTKINRITIYGILNSLKNKGFVSSTIKAKKTQFIPAPPKSILELIKRKETRFSSIIPELQDLSGKIKCSSSTKLYEGLKSVYELMQEIFGSGQKVLSYGNLDLPEKFYEFDTKNLRNLRLNAKTEIRGITNKLPEEFAKRKLWQKQTNARILKKLDKLTTWTYIYGNKVANITYEKELIGVVVDNEEIANTQRFIFEVLWEKSKKK